MATDDSTYSPIYSLCKNYLNKAWAHGYNQLQQFAVNIIFIMDKACLNGKHDTASIATADPTIDLPTIVYFLRRISVFV